MKINEVEALVGITKKNIRFYEAEGLLAPRRNSDNGYRDYGEEDVAVLRRIKLMRKLGLPLEDIRQMLSGAQGRYGSSGLRQGRSRAFPRNHAKSGAGRRESTFSVVSSCCFMVSSYHTRRGISPLPKFF